MKQKKIEEQIWERHIRHCSKCDKCLDHPNEHCFNKEFLKELKSKPIKK